MKGYKVFNANWACSLNGQIKQYTCPGKFEENVDCGSGMHFCKSAADCFDYVNFNYANLGGGRRVAEIVAYGDILEKDGKYCTNKLQIIREITWLELLTLANAGKACTGLDNAGNRNTGNWNTGGYNTGDWNSGRSNTGAWNIGNRNVGDRNAGDQNTGDRNSGDRNSGDYNTGCFNTGCFNTAHENSGDWNSGNRNTGDRNVGDRNTGCFNAGNSNTGDWNIGDWNTGCFNTGDPKLKFFNKETNMTFEEWRSSDARHLLNQIDFRPTEWVWSEDMKIGGGHLEIRDTQDCYDKWWDELKEWDKNVIKNMPNFDPGLFLEITGIDVEK